MEIKIGFNATLLPFQRDSVAQILKFFAHNSTKAAYCANETGTGKTPIALSVGLTLAAPKDGVLICCPAIMRLVWEQEIYKFARTSCTDIPQIHVIQSQDDFDTLLAHSLPPSLPGYTIVTYDQLAKNSNAKKLVSKGFKFKLLIADEAHATKNYKAKRTKTFFSEVWPLAEYRLLMSATPFTKNVTDFYKACSAIMPEHAPFKSFMDFALRYSFMRLTPYGTDFYGLKNAPELSQTIRSNFYIRYKKEEVLKDLPPIQYQKVPLSDIYAVKPPKEDAPQIGVAMMHLAEMLVKDKTTEEFTPDDTLPTDSKSIGTTKPVTRSVISRAVATVRRAQGEMKVAPAAEYIEGFLEQEIPVVVFAHHKSVITGLAEKLSAHKPLVITGETPAAERQLYIKAFQEGNTDIIILNLIAGGIGITLTRAQEVILVEQSYVPSDIYQAVSRCHRIGSKGQVTVHWLSVNGSIDEKILDIVMQRTKEFRKVCDE